MGSRSPTSCPRPSGPRRSIGPMALRTGDERPRVVALLARCRDDPALFNHIFLRRKPYWWRQVELCESVVRYKTTVAVGGNSIGKDYWLGGIVPWWLWTRYQSLVFATGPSQTVLGTVTWKEIR